jgi:glutamate 5-kinase
VVIVSSGAIACGLERLGMTGERPDDMPTLQAAASVGQGLFVSAWGEAFESCGMATSLVLLTRRDTADRTAYLHARDTLERLLELGVVPIVNENDTVSIEELMFTDNDELSGLIARMVGAEMLILLTGVDGLYDSNPSEPGSKVIRQVRPGDDVSRYILPSKSSAGRGGMTSKFKTALSVAEAGIRVIIANGNRDDILPALIENPSDTVFTEFGPFEGKGKSEQ